MNTPWEIPSLVASFKEKLSQLRCWCRSLFLYVCDAVRDASLHLFPDVRRARRSQRLAFQREELGELEPVIEFFIEAAHTFSGRGLIRKAVDCYAEACDLYTQLGSPNSAMITCREAISTVEGRARGWNGAYCYLVISSMLGDLNLHSEAIRFLRLGRRVFEEEKNDYYMAIVNSLIALHMHDLGENQEAIDILMLSVTAFQRQRDDESVMFCHGLLASIYCDIGAHDRAAECQQAIRLLLVKEGNHWFADCTDVPLFEAFYTLDRAIVGYDWLMKLDGSYTRRLWGYFDALGIYLRLLGYSGEARKNFRRSVEAVEIMRDNLCHTSSRASFLERTHSAYYDMITASLKEGDAWTALEHLERLKSRNLAEMVSARVDDPGTQDTAASNSSPDASVDTTFREEFRCGLNLERTAIVFLLPMKATTLIFVATLEGDAVHLSDASGDCTFDDVTSYVHGMSHRALGSNKGSLYEYLEATLTELSDKLYGPISELLPESTQKIIFVPYSGFHLLPLHAMYKEKNGNRRCVLDDYLVEYAPSLKMLKECRARERSYGGPAFVA